MASQLSVPGLPSGLTIYGVFTAEAGTIWNGTALVARNIANWATYAVPASEFGTTGIYYLTVPATLPAGSYTVLLYSQAGGSPALPPTDASQGGGELQWDGAAVSLAPSAVDVADTLLKRDWTAVTGEAARSVLNALRRLRNRSTRSGAAGVVMKEDDTTPAWTAAVSVTEIDPA